jgi:hypothetical protein
VGPVTIPDSPIAPIIALSALVTFVLVAYLARRGGFRTAGCSAIVATIAALMIFELPFDLIVIGRVYAPTPAI